MADTIPFFDYVPGWRIQNLFTQTMACQRLYPELNNKSAALLVHRLIESNKQVPEEMEGFALVPKMSVFARLGEVHGANRAWPIFNKSLWYLHSILSRVYHDRVLITYSSLAPDSVKLTARTERALRILEANAEGDYMVLPVQLGKKNAGEAPGVIESECGPNEFTLDPYTLGAILASHAAQIPRYGSMRIDCPGAMYSYRKDGKYADASRWDVQDSCLVLDWNFEERERPHQGTATGLTAANL